MFALTNTSDLDAKENPERGFKTVSTVSFGDIRVEKIASLQEQYIKSQNTYSNRETKSKNSESFLFSLLIEQEIKRLEEQIEHLHTQKKLGVAKFSLRSTENSIIVKEEKILALIEVQPLTVQNLADSIGALESDVERIVRRLFNEGYIDTVNGGAIRKIFPRIAKKERLETSFSKETTNFTTTLKGYFRLHPFISIKR